MDDFSIPNDGLKANGYMTNMNKLEERHWKVLLALRDALPVKTKSSKAQDNDDSDDPDISVLEENHTNIFFPSSPMKP